MSAPDTTARPSDLPDFEQPPVVEVALSVQFEPLPFVSRHIAELWESCRSEFPDWQDHPPIGPAFELFDEPLTNARALLSLNQVKRAIFRNPLGTELKQYQADRFVRNWTKASSAPSYPRYESVREPFAADLRALVAFVSKEGLGTLVANQCEVTYVNLVPLGEGAATTVASVVRPWSGTFSDSFLNSAESCEVGAHFAMADPSHGPPIGRLHIVGRVVTMLDTGGKALQLTLTARGQPMRSDVAGVINFLNIGREHIVRGFTSFTTAEMHSAWGRRDGRN